LSVKDWRPVSDMMCIIKLDGLDVENVSATVKAKIKGNRNWLGVVIELGGWGTKRDVREVFIGSGGAFDISAPRSDDAYNDDA
jgi:hypothetical protein